MFVAKFDCFEFPVEIRAVTDASIVVMEILIPRALQHTSIPGRDFLVFWLETYKKEGSVFKLI